MHQGNREWLAYAQATYGHRWMYTGILELGALDWNGSARELLRSELYVGVDRTAGPGVDIVCDAATTDFRSARYGFGCLLCASLLEHSPYWRQVLTHNLRWMKRNGVLLLSWGAEGNLHHAPEPWSPVPVGDVLEIIAPACDIIEAYWEKDRFTGDCAGCYDIIAVKR